MLIAFAVVQVLQNMLSSQHRVSEAARKAKLQLRTVSVNTLLVLCNQRFLGLLQAAEADGMHRCLKMQLAMQAFTDTTLKRHTQQCKPCSWIAGPLKVKADGHVFGEHCLPKSPSQGRETQTGFFYANAGLRE